MINRAFRWGQAVQKAVFRMGFRPELHQAPPSVTWVLSGRMAVLFRVSDQEPAFPGVFRDHFYQVAYKRV